MIILQAYIILSITITMTAMHLLKIRFHAIPPELIDEYRNFTMLRRLSFLTGMLLASPIALAFAIIEVLRR